MIKTKFPWLNRNIIGFGIASFFSDSSHEIVPLVLPALVIQLVGHEHAPSYLGFISGLATAAAGVTTLFSGWLSDRIRNRKPLILSGYALAGTLVGLIGLAHSWITILFLHVCAWIGRGLVSAPRNALIADSTPPAYYGHAFGFRQALDTAGAVAGPLIVYFFSGQALSTLFLIALIPGLLALLVIALFIKEVPRTPVTMKKYVPLGLLPGNFYLFLTAMFIFGMGNFSKTLLLLHMQNTLAGSYPTATVMSIITLFYILRNIAQAGASYVMGALSDSIGRMLPLALGGFTLFGIMSILLIWSSANLLSLFFIFLISGISAGTYMSLEKSAAADLLPKELRGTGYGILQTINSIGDLLSSVIVGFLWAAFSPKIGFLYAALMSFSAALILIPLQLRQRSPLR